ncbi:hypothetical protein [Aliarcobacter cryaerophilus]
MIIDESHKFKIFLTSRYKEFLTNIKSNSQQVVAQLQNDKIDKIF